MIQKTALAAVAALAFPAAVPGAPSVASLAPAAVGSSAALLLGSSDDDRAIRRAFEDILDREPTSREMERYRTLMREERWSERELRDDVRDYADDRDRHDGDRHRSGRYDEDPDRIVRRAYQDILHREPDDAGLRLYRSRILDDDWTEDQVRDALRKSPERKTLKAADAEKVIRRAYEDILDRQPDAAGLANYRNKMMNQGWDEREVREALKKSPEYRRKTTMTPQAAQEIVRRAYQSVLGREPDAGSKGYVDKVLRQHWTQDQVEAELKKSPEYRSKH